MATQPLSDAARDLGTRLRQLRETHFGRRVTQRDLGRAISPGKPLSGPLISSWESGSALPPEQWITEYATFFSTERSLVGGAPRVLPEDDLTAEERANRDHLLSELTAMRDVAQQAEQSADVGSALGGPWHFADGNPIRIVCAEIPRDQQKLEATPTHPTLAYGRLYQFSSIDALLELWGHVRAANPHSDIRILKDSEASKGDLAEHLVILGGIDWNPLSSRVPELLPDFPVHQRSTRNDPKDAYFEIEGTGDAHRYGPDLSADGDLLVDIGLFVRAPNPLNARRTLTICNAMFSLGTLGVVQALTDTAFRDRNTKYLDDRLAEHSAVGILMRVLFLTPDEPQTPDWTQPRNRLYEWPESPS